MYRHIMLIYVYTYSYFKLIYVITYSCSMLIHNLDPVLKFIKYL